MTNDATRASATALPEISRRHFLTKAATAGAAVAVAAPVVASEPEIPLLTRLHEHYEEASRPRELAIWHMRELERLAHNDGADEAMVTVVGRFHTPKFHCKTLLLCHRDSSIDDFGDTDFLTGKTVQS